MHGCAHSFANHCCGLPVGKREDAHANTNDPWHGSARNATCRTNEKAPGALPGPFQCFQR
ncbi:hypothetical protein RK21_05304 [Pseudomonas plecoglossicida]|nr:hypothetical protein RK21_05304 [Pseudomonas plecoglossicida]